MQTTRGVPPPRPSPFDGRATRDAPPSPSAAAHATRARSRPRPRQRGLGAPPEMSPPEMSPPEGSPPEGSPPEGSEGRRGQPRRTNAPAKALALAALALAARRSQRVAVWWVGVWTRCPTLASPASPSRRVWPHPRRWALTGTALMGTALTGMTLVWAAWTVRAATWLTQQVSASPVPLPALRASFPSWRDAPAQALALAALALAARRWPLIPRTPRAACPPLAQAARPRQGGRSVQRGQRAWPLDVAACAPRATAPRSLRSGSRR